MLIKPANVVKTKGLFSAFRLNLLTGHMYLDQYFGDQRTMSDFVSGKVLTYFGHISKSGDYCRARDWHVPENLAKWNEFFWIFRSFRVGFIPSKTFLFTQNTSQWKIIGGTFIKADMILPQFKSWENISRRSAAILRKYSPVSKTR